MKVLCVVQARMGSTRLPGKVMKKICDKTVLEHDIDRLKRVKNIDNIIIATTENTIDEVLVKEANRLNIKYFRGSERNVLSRYYYASMQNKADIVVRVTSDCPLIDSRITEDIIKFFIENIDKYDYVSNTINRTFPRGLDVEVFKFCALEKAFNEAVSARDKEHVTPYIWDNPKIFNIGQYIGQRDYSKLRWTLDTEEDFKLIEKIYDYIYEQKNNDFYMDDILKLYESHNELNDINRHIVQKHI